MHDLAPLTALAGKTLRTEKVGQIAFAEVTDLALASVAARLGAEDDCRGVLERLLGAPPPAPGKASAGAPLSAFWSGPEQWMLCAPFATHEDIAARLEAQLAGAASVTEQTDGWAVFDLEGPATVDLFERLCPVPVRRMAAGEVQRTTIDHLGAFVWCREHHARFRVLGPRSAAASLLHALLTAARSVA